MSPNRYCLAFGVTFMNQGAALLHVYTDGSILLSHGGMEMGQGLHTKMVQVSVHSKLATSLYSYSCYKAISILF